MAPKDFPPDIPDSLEELDRVIILLGTLSKGDSLRAGKRAELEQLIGCRAPGAKVAATWKSNLKKWRSEKVAGQHKEEE